MTRVVGHRHRHARRAPRDLSHRTTLDAAGEFVVARYRRRATGARALRQARPHRRHRGPSEDFARVEKAVRAALPASYLLERPGVRNDENQRMLRAFRWNLRVLGYISLVVGAFLIYNTISVSVVRRRAEIGILRAIGASRITVFALFLVEALLFGVVGAMLGVLLGRVLAGGAGGPDRRNRERALYQQPPHAGRTNGRRSLGGHPHGSAGGVRLGAQAGARSHAGGAHRGHEPRSARAPGAPALAARPGVVARLRRRRWRCRRRQRVAAIRWVDTWRRCFAIGAAALAAPAVVLAVNRATRRVTRRRAESLLAGRSLTASLSRTSVVVAALATAIAMMASVGIMVASFRETVALWLDVATARRSLRAARHPLGAPASTRRSPPRFPRCSPPSPASPRWTIFHGIEFHYPRRARHARRRRHRHRAPLRPPALSARRRPRRHPAHRCRDRDRAIVSEPFANKHRVRAGDRLTMPIGEHTVTLTVAGIYYDYSSSQGYRDRRPLARC